MFQWNDLGFGSRVWITVQKSELQPESRSYSRTEPQYLNQIAPNKYLNGVLVVLQKRVLKAFFNPPDLYCWDIFETPMTWAPQTKCWKTNKLHTISPQIKVHFGEFKVYFRGNEVYTGDITVTLAILEILEFDILFLSDLGVFWLSGSGGPIGFSRNAKIVLLLHPMREVLGSCPGTTITFEKIEGAWRHAKIVSKDPEDSFHTN